MRPLCLSLVHQTLRVYGALGTAASSWPLLLALLLLLALVFGGPCRRCRVTPSHDLQLRGIAFVLKGSGSAKAPKKKDFGNLTASGRT